MSPRLLPVISGRQALRVLERAGFVLNRVHGSHHILIHPDRPRAAVSVPVHGNRDLPKGTLRAIIEQAGLSAEEFVKLVK